MEKMENSSQLKWEDLPIPCAVLIKPKDVEGITQNPPFETVITNLSMNRDMARTMSGAWINTNQYDLLEVVIVNNREETNQ